MYDIGSEGGGTEEEEGDKVDTTVEVKDPSLHLSGLSDGSDDSII